MNTWAEIIRDAANRFERGKIDESLATAEYLAAFVLGVWNRSELRPFLQQTPTPAQLDAYEKVVSRRLQQEPLQYIVGETEFFGLRLYCSPAALIPRAETEILVEEALAEISRFGGNVRVLDIGTGTGAIVLALASRSPNAHFVGIDISDEAIALAERNRKRLGLTNVEFIQAAFPAELDRLDAPFDIVVSNPPYVPHSEWAALDENVRAFEPRIALTDNADGFSFYEAIATNGRKLLRNGGKVIVETEYKGAPHVAELFRSHGLIVERTVRDLLNHERVVVASLS